MMRDVARQGVSALASPLTTEQQAARSRRRRLSVGLHLKLYDEYDDGWMSGASASEARDRKEAPRACLPEPITRAVYDYL